MKKRITITAVLVGVLALAAAPIVVARTHAGGGGMHHFGILAHLKHAKEELDLSDQQAEQIHAIFAEMREQNAQHRVDMHGTLMQVTKTLLADPNDVAGAQALLEQQATAERAMKANLLQATARAIAVLNAEQRVKLGTMIENFAARHGRRGR